MNDFSISIDLLRFQSSLNIEKRQGGLAIFDPIRNRFLVKTPEEVVRQLMIQYLILEKKVRKNFIAVEKMLIVNEVKKRFDILVYDETHAPQLMIECKAPQVAISQETFHQVATYNLPLQVRYLMVTNGILTYCCKMDYSNRTFEFLTEVPSFPELYS